MRKLSANRNQIADEQKFDLLKMNSTNQIIFVECRIVFLTLHDIDTTNETFSGELYIEAKWSAEYESEVLESQNQSIDWKPKWNPDLKIVNSIDDTIISKWYKILKENNSYKIIEIQKIKGTFHEKLELKNYPFDVQHLNIKLSSRHFTDKCILTKDKTKLSDVLVENFRDSQEWILYEYVNVEEGHKFLDDYSIQQGEHSIISFNCIVRRKSTYFNWNAFFLIFLITGLGFSIFGIPYTDVGYRVDGTIGLILTSVSFKWLVNNTLPSIDYLTFADLYSIFGIVFLTVLTSWHSIIGYFHKEWNGILVDLSALCTLFGIFVAIHLIFIISYYYLIHKPLKEYERLETEFKRQHVNSRSINI